MSDHLAKTMKFGVREKTLTSYLMGFFLSLLFTFSAFALIGWHVLRAETAYIVITVLAIAQLFAQIIFFLRLNNTAEGRWNTLPFIFTIIIVSVLVGGSLWIMYNLNMNMM